MRKLTILFITIIISIGCTNSNTGELIFVKADHTKDFNFPYYLFIPDDVTKSDSVFVIVEPNNSGFADDDFQKHIEKAERTAIKDFYLGNYLAQNLNYPLLIPVFPRTKSNWKIYTHSLDRDVMLQKNNNLERIDLQLINMQEDANKKLCEKGIKTHKQFLLTGFSASGTFANRFTLLHPDKVYAAAAGGINGLLILPIDALESEALNYPIGTNDMFEMVGKSFQKELFLSTPQFYFMGELDDNDAIPYADGYDENEREQIFRLLGKQMQPERWNNCIKLYEKSKVNATLKTYENTGHEHPEKIKKEVLDFFNASISKLTK